MLPFRIKTVLGRFARDHRGNFATIFAASLIPLLGIAGLATDFGKSSLVKRRMDVAIDAASLAALNKTVQLLNEGKTSDAVAISAGEDEGRRYLIAQAAAIIDGSVQTPTVKITQQGSTLTSTVSYDASVPTVFSQFFGKSSFEVDGHSAASVTLPPFYDIHVLVDISASMGIGATETDQQILYDMKVKVNGKQQKNNCTFACHIMQPGYKETTYTSGRSAGATMRIDIVRSALLQVAQRLLTDPSKRYRLAIHTLHTKTATLIPLSNDLAMVKAAINSGVQLAPAYGGTNFHVALRNMDKTIATPGDGVTQDRAKSAIIFMTDGVEDTQTEQPGSTAITWDPTFVYFSPSASDWGGLIQPLNPQLCAPIKQRGIRMIAMNTKYIAPAQDGNAKFVAIRNWMHLNISRNMQSCVSSSTDYYDASSPSDIQRATNEILNSISKPIALTQ